MQSVHNAVRCLTNIRSPSSQPYNVETKANRHLERRYNTYIGTSIIKTERQTVKKPVMHRGNQT
ncbi:hypothetical protein E2C01_045715 [Portunus trituberculatus]|uniref:Uncharacterized protein n=1 Tax=Portunus trituberculatus TaxID=210409 RepID=A0A5B7FZ12_PORTR|nr:hypothetical protein [Portunus trituberculatus]